ncbi:hypothetical protein [Burkholderia contaminans]|uniref:hypothetical protein n=1 Tax=Burkholderia contaminans TaxID=488447 RepID=UPI00064A647E|nr:hypothetical protein [Burkholderia contaminans]
MTRRLFHLRVTLPLSVIAIGAACTLAYGLYQITPMGEPLARHEVIGELDGPALSPYARVVTYRDAGRLLLATESAVSSSDIAQLERAAVLDPQVPALRERLQEQQRQLVVAGAAHALVNGNTDLAAKMIAAGKAAMTDTQRSLIHRDRPAGGFDLLASIASNNGVKLIGTPQGRTLYLITSTIRDAGGNGHATAWDTLRSDDLGSHWRYDPDIVLDPTLTYPVFLTENRIVAMDDKQLVYSTDRARHWSSIAIAERVWPDAEALDQAYDEKASAQDTEVLTYDWSLYPVDTGRAVGWSWRQVVQRGSGVRGRTLETRRFEVRLRDGAPPDIVVTRGIREVPEQDRFRQVVVDQAIYGTIGNRIYRLDKPTLSWRQVATTPDVRGTTARIDQAWLGRKAWVVSTLADHLLPGDTYTKTFFRSHDDGKTWQPFRLSQEQDSAVLGLDDAGGALLIHAVSGDKTVIERYPLD